MQEKKESDCLSPLASSELHDFAKTLPYDEEVTWCYSCGNQARCRVFYRLKRKANHRQHSNPIQESHFFCYNCFAAKRQHEGYHPLLLNTNQNSLTVTKPSSSSSAPTLLKSFEDSQQQLKEEVQQQPWYNQLTPLSHPPRVGEQQQQQQR